jgi:hypothetical protein
MGVAIIASAPVGEEEAPPAAALLAPKKAPKMLLQLRANYCKNGPQDKACE